MFKENKDHLQGILFNIYSDLSEAQINSSSFQQSELFYSEVFCEIDETIFSPLYSDNSSRPNAPINSLVSALILKHQNNWSFSALFDQINFNLLTKRALGLQQIDEQPFSYKTIFNFMNRLADYHEQTKIDLMEVTFQKLSKKYITKYELKTDVQRCDSTFLDSNIKNITRLQLLIEVVRNMLKQLTSTDIEGFTDAFQKYHDPQKYIYNLSHHQYPNAIDEVALIYHQLNIFLESENDYIHFDEFKIFKRVFDEHFRYEDDKIITIPKEELNSDTVQSPYDDEATYKNKSGEKHQGYKVNGVETANPENPIQLVTDVEVDANNVDDSATLTNVIDDLIEFTPDLKEFHTDGAYGSEINDLIMEVYGVTHVQTAVRGRVSPVRIVIVKSDDVYSYRCPYQEADVSKTPKQNKAQFDKTKCEQCSESDVCPIYKKGCKVYFDERDYLANKRKNNIFDIPEERKFSRNNGEATMKNFVCKLNFKGKLKTRGLYRAKIFAFSTAIAINFGRVFRFEWEKMLENLLFLLFLPLIFLIKPNYSERDGKSWSYRFITMN